MRIPEDKTSRSKMANNGADHTANTGQTVFEIQQYLGIFGVIGSAIPPRTYRMLDFAWPLTRHRKADADLSLKGNGKSMACNNRGSPLS